MQAKSPVSRRLSHGQEPRQSSNAANSPVFRRLSHGQEPGQSSTADLRSYPMQAMGNAPLDNRGPPASLELGGWIARRKAILEEGSESPKSPTASQRTGMIGVGWC